MESALLAHLMGIPWDSYKEIPLGSILAFEPENRPPPHAMFAGSLCWLLLMAHRPSSVSKEPSKFFCDTSQTSLNSIACLGFVF